MYISRINIKGFGKFKDFETDLGDGLNLVTGANEAGKSTLHLFIRAMFYGLSTKRTGPKSDYERMRPWTEPDIYGGSMELKSDGKTWRIERDFARSADDLGLSELRDGVAKPSADPEGDLAKLLRGMSEDLYVNTLCVRQLGLRADKSLADEIIRYATDTGSTGNPSLSALRSIEYLSRVKRELSGKLSPEASREYNITLGRIRSIREKLTDESMRNRITEADARRIEAAEKADTLSKAAADKEAEIGRAEAELTPSGIRSRRDAETFSLNIETLYGEYGRHKAHAPVYKAIGIIMIIIGAAGAALLSEAAGEIPALSPYLGLITPYRNIGFTASAVLAVLGLISVIYGSSLKHKSLKEEDSLRGLVSEHLMKEPGAEPQPISEDMDELRAKASEYLTKGERLDALRSDRDKLMKELSLAAEEHTRRIRDLDGELRQRDLVEEDLTHLNELYHDAEILRRRVADNERISDEIEAVELAADIIRDLGERISRSAGIYINKEAGRMIRDFTGGAYESIYVGEGLDVRLMGRDGMIPVRDLSQGTMDEVYLALRIAAARYAAASGDEIPLTLDDSFAMFDDERLKGALRFIAESFRGQAVIFSCQYRERDAVGEAGLPCTLINI